MRMCWCGNSDFLPFSPDYRRCSTCGTLVLQVPLTNEQLAVNDDDVDFYGKQYWLKHQADDFNYPDIYVRARNDLSERNLYWLRTLLKYQPPPATTLELGCAHGSFVALMRQAGYDASGVEMSAWVVEFGRKTFGIPMQVGPIEALSIAHGSLDVIALMDVLEHLPDPVTTMRTCLDRLKPDGILLVQTPQFTMSMRYEQLLETHSPFLEQLKLDEHLFLFTEESATRLFAQLDAHHMQFEPAIFAMYDMFFAVSRSPLRPVSKEQSEAALSATPGGRIAQALLDLKERELALVENLRIAEVDRTQRGESVTSLTVMLAESEADRAARGEQVVELTRLLATAEADRLSRGQQIEALTALLKESDFDRAAHEANLVTLTRFAQTADADRVARGEQVETLNALLREAEADRAARGEQIVTLTAMLTESEGDRAARGIQIETLTNMIRQGAADQAARERSLTAWRQRVEEALERTPVNGARERERWSEIRCLLEQIGSDHV